MIWPAGEVEVMDIPLLGALDVIDEHVFITEQGEVSIECKNGFIKSLCLVATTYLFTCHCKFVDGEISSSSPRFHGNCDVIVRL